MHKGSSRADWTAMVYFIVGVLALALGLCVAIVAMLLYRYSFMQLMMLISLVGVIVIVVVNGKYFFRHRSVEVQAQTRFSVGPALDEYDNTQLATVHQIGANGGAITIARDLLKPPKTGYTDNSHYTQIELDKGNGYDFIDDGDDND